jgi:MerR family transcriptional regulator, light-induced transcriptional regulator
MFRGLYTSRPLSTSPKPLTEADLYRIGTVAKLTGISVECLRAWERRHGIEPAQRDGRTRFYSHAQLRRLEKIKALVDTGHPISSLVELSDEQLEARTGSARSHASVHRVPQVGLIGPNLLILEQDGDESDSAEVAQRWVCIDDFGNSRQSERANLDAIAVQIPSLNAESIQRVQKAAPDCRLLAVYQFADRDALAAATRQGVTTLAWPLAWDDLMRACAQPTHRGARVGKTAPRRYSDHELVDIVTRARRLGLDAPRHLVGMISDLNAFGDYATQRLTDAADSELYEALREDVSHARAQLERALAQLLERRAVRA